MKSRQGWVPSPLRGLVGIQSNSLPEAWATLWRPSTGGISGASRSADLPARSFLSSMADELVSTHPPNPNTFQLACALMWTCAKRLGVR
jgi:hypothetical protein